MRSRLRRWVLLTGNRYNVAGGILVVMAGVVSVPLFTGFTIRNTTPLTYMASALITGNITLITVVVAINQVVLSQELESPGSLRNEVERTADYRQATLDQPTAPTDPSAFLSHLLQQTHQHTQTVAEHLPGGVNETNERLVTELPDHCVNVRETWEQTANDLSDVVVPLLDVDYGNYIHDCHQLQAHYNDESHDQLHSSLDQLASDLENIDIAHQYFTTEFVKEELATLSRSLLYIGIGAISLPIALLVQLTTYTGSSPPTTELFTLTFLMVVVGLIPLALLIAFVLRIATVAKSIAGITPFRA